MIISYAKINKKLIPQNGLPDSETTSVLWVDLINGTEEEKRRVEQRYGVELFTRQESEEIESSSQYSEEEDEIGINLSFLKPENGLYTSEPVSFILKGDILFTQRNIESKAFTDTIRRLNVLKPENGSEILIALMEIRIDFDADFIENVTDQISRISKNLIQNDDLDRDLLLKITSLQEVTILIRENIVEKQRVISSILKSHFFPKDNIDTIRIMIKDVNSLLDHTSFNFERLEFLQNTFLGLIDIEQNKVIKIFTVVTVIFMPPTLIASIYGMNFDMMPELDEIWGYPASLTLMFVSSALTLWFFKFKKWL